MKKIVLQLLAAICIVTAAAAQDKVPTHPDGQVFTTVKDATVYKYPFVTSDIIDTLAAGSDVTIVAYDPDNKWARIRMAPVDGVWTDRFIDLESIDFPAGQQLKITETFTGGDHNDDGSPKVRAERFGNETQMRYYYLLLCLIGVAPVAYRLLQRKAAGREAAFVGATVGLALAWLAYTYAHKAFGIRLEDSTGFWYMFFKMVVMIVVVYCAMPLIRWAWGNLTAKGSKPLHVILSILFLITIIYIALQALGLFFMVGFVLLALVGLFTGQSQDELNRELRRAVMTGRLGLAQRLINKGADINGQDRNGMTILMHTCKEGIINMAEWTLEKGADPNIKDNRGNTAMMHAAEQLYIDFFPILDKYGADPDAQNNNLQTAMMIYICNLHKMPPEQGE